MALKEMVKENKQIIVMLHNTKNITSADYYGNLYCIVKNTAKFLKSSKILKNIKRKR